ncbi:hypothetical protein [Clostridium sp. D53t1_180928_C8]|uniref:hypothetical protein n=1 Tax=Clostridium sp. D53t1_180928_C8 TaxID=2787101 RepID=UPI0018A99A53|nr:hypothetical protein [Clostridium sp. D53t1_180928_C8]
MNKHSECGCHKDGSEKCTSSCSCGCSGAVKSAGNNQWASPASATSTVTDKCKCENKGK